MSGLSTEVWYNHLSAGASGSSILKVLLGAVILVLEWMVPTALIWPLAVILALVMILPLPSTLNTVVELLFGPTLAWIIPRDGVTANCMSRPLVPGLEAMASINVTSPEVA